MSASVTFGIDLSKYQGSLSIKALQKQGFEFFSAKCTEGQHTTDPTYQRHLAEAKESGVLFTAYHFLRSDSDPAAQAQNLADHIGDKRVRVMVDVEPSGSSHPTLAQANAFREACKHLGLDVTLLYDPYFWWSQSGSPNLRGTGWALWQARYPFSHHEFASVLYQEDGGSNGSGWAPEGGVVPTIWQFASSAKVSGYSGNVDVDAFRGSRDELAAKNLFTDFAPKPKPAPKPATAPAPAPAPQPAPKPNRVTRARDLLKAAWQLAKQKGWRGRRRRLAKGLQDIPKR